MTGHASHFASCRIMNLAAQHPFRCLLGWSNSPEQRGFRKISRISHSQRSENFRSREVLQLLPADPLHDLSQKNEVDVAITKNRARWVCSFLPAGQGDAVLVAGPGRRPG